MNVTTSCVDKIIASISEVAMPDRASITGIRCGRSRLEPLGERRSLPPSRRRRRANTIGDGMAKRPAPVRADRPRQQGSLTNALRPHAILVRLRAAMVRESVVLFRINAREGDAQHPVSRAEMLA